MVCSTRQSPRSVWEVARKQHGVVARWQLLELGLSRRAIQHRLKIGRLHWVMRGVYAVGRAELTPLGRWMAAVLASGPNAALSHRSAAGLWGIRTQGAGAFEVTVPSRSGRGTDVPGVRTHRRTGLARRDFTCCKGIPVTRPVLTLVDIAGLGRQGDGAWLSNAEVERAVNEAIGSISSIRTRSGPGSSDIGGAGALLGCGSFSTGARSASPTRNWSDSFCRLRRRRDCPCRSRGNISMAFASTSSGLTFGL